MKFFINRNELFNAASKAATAAAVKGVRPILSNILIIAKQNTVSFIGTDTEIMQIATVDADVEQIGRITVSSKLLVELTNTLPSDSLLPVEVELLKLTDELLFKLNDIEFKIKCLDADEFPPIPEIETEYIEICALKFYTDLFQGSSACGDTSANPIQQSTLLDFENGVIASTDSKRLAHTEFKIEAKEQLKNSHIVPIKAAKEVLKILSDSEKIKIGFFKQQLVFKSNDSIFITRLISGKFPDYKRVIPKKSKSVVTFKTKEFSASIKRVMPIARSSDFLVNFEIKTNETVISSNSKDKGSIKSKVKNELTGDEINISFNAKFIQDFLSTVKTDEIKIKLTDPNYPGIFQSNDFQYVLMPMRF
jgi:DNA polymerase-3 subunit beta